MEVAGLCRSSKFEEHVIGHDSVPISADEVSIPLTMSMELDRILKESLLATVSVFAISTVINRDGVHGFNVLYFCSIVGSGLHL